MRDLEDILEPNKYKLDDECVEQPKIIQHYLDEVTETRIEMDARKELIDEIKAELDKKIRENPVDFGFEKEQRLTETLISNTIILQKEYKKIFSEYLESKKKWMQASNVVEAISHRKSSLDNLVKLHGMAYFAEPKEFSKNSTLVRDKAKKNIKKKISKKNYKER